MTSTGARVDPVKEPSVGAVPLVPFAIYSALLLAILLGCTVGLMPSQTPEKQREAVATHQVLRNFIVAKRMIAPLVTAPHTRWSAPLQCREIGKGVWFAEGYVGIESDDGQETPTLWKAIFVPATSHPLYLGVGTTEQGDFNAALHEAGLAPKSP
jgi:hypothetical protein